MLKIIYIGQSATKLRTGERSTTMALASTSQAFGDGNREYCNYDKI